MLCQTCPHYHLHSTHGHTMSLGMAWHSRPCIPGRQSHPHPQHGHLLLLSSPELPAWPSEDGRRGPSCADVGVKVTIPFANIRTGPRVQGLLHPSAQLATAPRSSTELPAPPPPGGVSPDLLLACCWKPKTESRMLLFHFPCFWKRTFCSFYSLSCQVAG